MKYIFEPKHHTLVEHRIIYVNRNFVEIPHIHLRESHHPLQRRLAYVTLSHCSFTNRRRLKCATPIIAPHQIVSTHRTPNVAMLSRIRSKHMGWSWIVMICVHTLRLHFAHCWPAYVPRASWMPCLSVMRGFCMNCEYHLRRQRGHHIVWYVHFTS